MNMLDHSAIASSLSISPSSSSTMHPSTSTSTTSNPTSTSTSNTSSARQEHDHDDRGHAHAHAALEPESAPSPMRPPVVRPVPGGGKASVASVASVTSPGTATTARTPGATPAAKANTKAASSSAPPSMEVLDDGAGTLSRVRSLPTFKGEVRARGNALRRINSLTDVFEQWHAPEYGASLFSRWPHYCGDGYAS